MKLTTLRSLLLSSSLALVAAACGAPSNHGEGFASTDAITDVNQGGVKDQSIGNCWIYATAGWVESLNHTGGGSLDVSESYWTYWHWFEQIANSGLRGKTEVSTGGTWSTATRLAARYGIMQSADFVADDGSNIYSTRQSTALAAINKSLKEGALKTTTARKDRALVRKELDAAWGLGDDVKKELDATFGGSVSTTLDRSDADLSATKILRATDVPVAFLDPSTHAQTSVKLADLFEDGQYGWGEVEYPSDATERRHVQERVQRALHDHAPVVLSWLVDFNALNADGAFAAPPMMPGRQGGHMVVMEDYEIDGVPGFGTLKAGEPATPEQEQAALDDAATIKFFRVKNSWGDYHSAKSYPTKGYHDLYMAYLDGPVKQCEVDADDNPKLDHCWDATPLWSVVLPQGY